MSDLIPWLAPWSGRAVVSVVFLAGIALMLWAARRRRWKSPRCRRCAYDLSASPSLKCPECGWAAADTSDALFGKRRWRLALLGLVIAIALPTYVFIKRTRQYGWEYYLTFGPGHYFFGLQTLDTITVDGVRLRVIRDRSPHVWQQTLEISDAAGVREMESHSWFIGDDISGAGIGRGEDITGNGKPDIVIMEFTGGAHCCFEFHVYEVDPPGTMREIATIDGYDGGSFDDVNGDALPEFMTQDWSLAYELTCFACLRYPTVILKFDGSNYVPAADLMREPPPAETPSQFAQRVHADHPEASDARDALFGEMFHRIYTGHAESAWQCFDLAWRDAMGEKREARDKVLKLLRASPYVAALQELNGGSFDPPAE